MKNLKTTKLLLVNSHELKAEDMAALARYSISATPVATFDGADVEWQNYYLYDLVRR